MISVFCEKERVPMKKLGEWLLTMLCLVFFLSAGLAAFAACGTCVLAALGLTELVFGFELYVYLHSAMPVGALVALLFCVFIFVYAFLMKRKYEDFTGLLQLGEEVTGWLAKCVGAYCLSTVVSQLILLVRFWDVQIGNIQDAMGFVTYMLDNGWLWLGLAAVLTVVNMVLKKLAYDK